MGRIVAYTLRAILTRFNFKYMLEEKIKWILEEYPETKGNNTELYIKILDLAMQSRHSKLLPDVIKQAMKDYPPETVTRARRKIEEPTQEQLIKEKEFKKQYAGN